MDDNENRSFSTVIISEIRDFKFDNMQKLRKLKTTPSPKKLGYTQMEERFEGLEECVNSHNLKRNPSTKYSKLARFNME